MLAAETMNGHTFHIGKLRHAAIGVVAVALACVSYAQTSPPPPASTAAAPAAPAGKTFSQEQLEQLVAPIALHPDSLLAQMLMASTYPLDIVMADRWVKANPKVKDKALEDAMQKQPWDPNVKGLTAVPQALAMMSEKLEWTQQLGDAFLAQRQELMAAVQKLRQKASAQGNLKESKEQKVITEQVAQQTVIKIEPADPQVVYVPSYNPTVVYGAWPYPAYPPYYYPPAPYYGYYAGAGLVGFTAGVIVGGAIWGNANWGGGDVDIDVNKSNNFNRTNNTNKNFQHNPERRGGVPYKDQRTAQQYNRGQSANAGTRDDFRGRDGQSDRAGDRTGDRAGDRTGDRAGDRAGDRSGDRAAGVSDRSANTRDAGGASAGTRDVGGGGRDANVGRDVGGGSRDISSGRASAGTSDRGGGGNYGGGGGHYGSSGSAFGGGSGASARSSSSRGSSSMASSRGGGGGAARWWWRARRWRSAMTSHLPMRLSQTEGKLVMINRIHFRFKRVSLSAAFVLCTLGISTAFAAAPAQRTFASAEEAAAALVQAVKKGDRAGILAVLGKDAASSLSSGDAIDDRLIAERFVTRYETKHAIVADGDKRATLTIDADDFPFAYPLVKTASGWRFDAKAGNAELLARRVGENELAVMNVLLAIVDAQREYASLDRDGNGAPEYAAKFASTPGKKDGLYWPTYAGEPPSPLGTLVARAAGQGYKKADGPQPYHGYYFRSAKRTGRQSDAAALTTTPLKATRSAASRSLPIRPSMRTRV